MKNKSLTGIIALGLVAAMGAEVRAADSCGGGCPILPKAARSVSTAFASPMPAYPAPILVATIAKTGRRRMVNVEVSVATSLLVPGFPATPAVFVDVNGLAMEPLSAGPAAPMIVDCSVAPGLSCTLTGSFWIDLDQNPSLIGVPLVVTLSGGDLGAPGYPFTASMTARLTKK